MDTLKGYVNHIIFRNEDSAYTVFELVQGTDTVTCTGVIASISEGESCAVTGRFTQHPVYGEQFNAASYTVCAPEGTEALLRYLSSGAIRGVGASLAQRILSTFGEDTQRILNEEPERLAEIRGISERMAREIAAQLEGRKDLRDAMIFMEGFGIRGQLAMEIYRTYGMELYTVITNYPYRLYYEIDGMGFARADEIARRNSVHVDPDERIRAAFIYLLSLSLQEGHFYRPAGELISDCCRLTGAGRETAEILLSGLAVDGRVVIKRGDQVYLTGCWLTEQQSAAMLLRLDAVLPDPEEADAMKARIPDILQELGTEPDPLQIKALEAAAERSVLLISGGPGTGKTTGVNAIIRMFTGAGLNVSLAAPTGRAARRLSETTGYEASTIHRLLGVRAVRERHGGTGSETGRTEEFRARTGYEGNGIFEKNEEDPLETDAVIVDEMSMVDGFLFHALLRALPAGCRLIMVGDADQLPSVGPGRVMQDLMDSGCFTGVVLQTIFRQAMESDIVMNAHRVLTGEELQLDNRSRDFFFLQRQDPAVICRHMVELMRDRLPGYLGCTVSDIQVLTPMKKGPLGSISLNRHLQGVLNPPGKGKAELVRGENTFRTGDKVMQTRNDYQLEYEKRSPSGYLTGMGTGIYNGDFGVIRDVDHDGGYLDIEFDDGRFVRYPYQQLDDLELAYAITVHKSQGSEYAAVLLPLLSGPSSLFNRNLLYTAITRARGTVVILGDRDTVRRMQENIAQNTRCTGLAAAVREMDALSMQDPGSFGYRP